MTDIFYGAEQARIHHQRFGTLAAKAADDLLSELGLAGLPAGTVVDLGCGSGILARAMTDAGYAVVGVDVSPDMVALAQAHAPDADVRVGSAYDVELPAGCVGVAAVGEVLNYGADERAGVPSLHRLAGRAHAALRPGGVFLFDVSGPGRGGATRRMQQFHSADDWCLGMVATESDDGRRLDRAISVFALDPDGRYRRTDEHHTLRLYARDEVVALLTAAGFEVSVRDDYSDMPVRPGPAGWYVVVARKPAG